MEVTPLRPLLRQGPSSLRPAAPRDFAALVELARSTAVFTTEELSSLAYDVTVCDPAAGDQLTVYADQSSDVVGFVQFSPAEITQGTWFVYWIAVAKRTHGRGIGAALLAHAEDEIRAAGGRQVLIETSSQLAYEPTRRFYLGKGYVLAARIPDYYADGDDKCIFLKRL